MIYSQRQAQVKVKLCEHKHTEVESYLNPCASAGCEFYGPKAGTHYNCGSQERTVCLDCGTVLDDTADDQIFVVICGQRKDGTERACGTTPHQIEEAQSWVAGLNERYPDRYFWNERV